MVDEGVYALTQIRTRSNGDTKPNYRNCYEYAIKVKSMENDPLCPGFLTGKYLDDEEYWSNVVTSRVIDYVRSDMAFLGYKMEKTFLLGKLNDGEFKLAIYVDNREQFHFARQDPNYRWSEMTEVGGTIQQVEENKIEQKPGYEFLGYYKISR